MRLRVHFDNQSLESGSVEVYVCEGNTLRKLKWTSRGELKRKCHAGMCLESGVLF
jgi:hypothetical protein